MTSGAGPVPPPRARHTAVAIDDKRLLVFGGIDMKRRYNDTWVLNIKTGGWEEIVVQGEIPPARAHHTITRVGDCLYIFGG